MTSLFDLKDKNAIITGSSKGIGKAIAYRMAEHGTDRSAQILVFILKFEEIFCISSPPDK